MKEFRMGDRVIINNTFKEKRSISRVNLKAGYKLVVTSHHPGQKVCKVIVNSGIDIGYSTYINVDKIDLDTQFYREKRLKKLLDR